MACSDAVLFPFFQRWQFNSKPGFYYENYQIVFILIFFNEWSHCKIEI